MNRIYPFKKILVTGGCGFIGSSYIQNILNNYDGIEVQNIDLMTYATSKKTLALLDEYKNFSHSTIDISNFAAIDGEIKNFSPDLIVNFAAESHVDNSIEGALPFINSNILGVFNLLEISKNLRDQNKKNFLFHQISTDEVYGDLDASDPAFTEEHPYEPSSPYSATKASADMLVSAWGRTFKIPYLITNCSNNFGPRQYSEKLIPKIIFNGMKGIDIPIYGNGLNIRDWIFVDDHTQAIIELHKKSIVAGRFNIGGDNEITNIDLVKNILGVLKVKYSLDPKIKFVEDRKGHDRRYAINMKKTNALLGDIPKNTFQENLETTIAWYIENSDWWDS
ncbi:dTDP-glucose 4,6-dehydratase [Gammaproteobacteria bacterium]|jgi:dTDP-glucose 4,6-dehydratase|nr:dTDP-glucose 4,6-dehydratase [Gammaproteobacteria bacterium]